MTRLFLLLGWIAVLGGLLLVGVITYWELWPYNPLTFTAKTFPVLTPTVKQGGVVQFTVDYCKHVSLSATNSHAFVNSIIYATPETTTSRQIGCHSITINVIVPDELPVGRYHLQNIYKYQVNPLRAIVIEHDTDEFQVIEKGR